VAKRRWRIHVPWGLFVILGLYGAGVKYYVAYHQENDPQVQAAKHLVAAARILGKDNGASASLENLNKAYEELLQALALFPDDKWAHEQIEQVEWQLRKRGRKPDEGQRRRAEMLANLWQQIQAGRQSVLPVGARDKWDVDAVLDFPNVASQYAMLGGLIIILLWAYREYQDYLHQRGKEDERHLDRREELRHMHVQRRR
jgi:hypothetical protein